MGGYGGGGGKPNLNNPSQLCLKARSNQAGNQVGILVSIRTNQNEETIPLQGLKQSARPSTGKLRQRCCRAWSCTTASQRRAWRARHSSTFQVRNQVWIRRGLLNRTPEGTALGEAYRSHMPLAKYGELLGMEKELRGAHPIPNPCCTVTLRACLPIIPWNGGESCPRGSVSPVYYLAGPANSYIWEQPGNPSTVRMLASE